MARSFYYGTDAELLTGAQNFSAKVSSDRERLRLTELQTADYASAVLRYQEAYDIAKAPSTRTSVTLIAKDLARRELFNATAALARFIAALPDITPTELVSLGLALRNAPAPIAPPGTPDAFTVTLGGDGSLNLRWKCDNPTGAAGTIYQVWRRVAGESAFTFLANTGKKKFTDVTLPIGASGIVYQLRAVRSTAHGAFAQFPVLIGGGIDPMRFQLHAIAA